MRLQTVDHDTVHGLLRMDDAITAVRDAFLDFDAGHFEMPARLPLGDGKFLFMPTHHRPTGSAVVKTLSLNFERVPAISGIVTWIEVATADPLVLDAEAVTTLRTGAAVGVATDLMAPADASRLVMIGAGAQALHQVEAVHTVRPLTQVRVVDLDRGRATALATSLSELLPRVAVTVADNVDQALADAEIVNCATTSRQALFDAHALPDRVHVNAIGAFKPGMRELPDALLAASTIVVDDVNSAMSEAGEIIEAVRAGIIEQSRLIPIGRALRGRFEPAPVTVFKSVGIAAQDWAIAHLVAQRMAERRAELHVPSAAAETIDK